jgi:ribosomal protein S18 acetylase RimI-like enzyme
VTEPGSAPELRRATDADVPALAAIAAAAYAVYVPRIGRPPPPMVADYAAAVRDAETWVLDDGGRVAGYLVLAYHDDHVLLENVAVAPEQQGRGLGGRLLKYAEARTIAKGLHEIRLYTNEAMTENQALYERIGYQETHRGGDGSVRRVFYRKRLSG